LEGVADIAVSDSIYIADKNGIISKYFQGEKEFEIRLKDGFAPNKIEAEVDEKSFFVLDIENGEILKLDLNGNVLKSFADDRFKEAQSFQVDFDNKKVYVADKENNLLVFHFE
jgi:DNA-binding beta-propeller fold protein YncE